MKIAFFANDDFYIKTSRLGLIKELKKIGWDVFVVASETNKEYRNEIENLGAIFIPVKIRRGIDFWNNFYYFFQVWLICHEYKFDICHNFNPKPAIFASLAQKLAGIKKIFFSVSGRGYVFSSTDFRAIFFRFLAIPGYRLAGRVAKKIVFQNSADQDFFISKKIISSVKGVLIKGSGIDTDYFSSSQISDKVVSQLKEELNWQRDGKIVVMISRLIKSKGVEDFAEVAKILKNNDKKWQFVLVGPIDRDNPEGILENQIRKWEEEDILKWLGERKEIREILFLSDIFVFPSYYAEGLPKVVLEAMAMELPVIVAENNGLKEVVEDKKTGIIIPPRNIEKLAGAIESVLLDEKLAINLGKLARKKVLDNFSDEIVTRQTMELYKNN